jgi:Ribbon-helix-helix domain
MTKASKFGSALSRLKNAEATPEITETGKPENLEGGVQTETLAPDVVVELTVETPSTPENTNAGIPENLNPDLPEKMNREKYSTYLETELVTRMKILAARTRRKHHHIVEDALRDYLERHGG